MRGRRQLPGQSAGLTGVMVTTYGSHMAASTKRALSRIDLDALVDRAIDNDGSVIIKRPGRQDLAVIAAEKLRELDTTAYLLASPKNRRRLLAGIRAARAGKGRVLTAQEFRKQFGSIQ